MYYSLLTNKTRILVNNIIINMSFYITPLLTWGWKKFEKVKNRKYIIGKRNNKN